MASAGPSDRTRAGNPSSTPSPASPSGYLRKIKKALDEHPDAPQAPNKKKARIDACFADLMLAAYNRCPLLEGLSLVEMFAVVKPEVDWVKDLSLNCITNLFMALLQGRGAWKLHTSRPDDESCLCARTMDIFQGMLMVVGEFIDFEICMDAPDGTIVTLDNGGVSGFIERGLLHPENQLISAELCDGLQRLTVSRSPQRDDPGLADARGSITVGHSQDQEEAHMDEGGVGQVEDA